MSVLPDLQPSDCPLVPASEAALLQEWNRLYRLALELQKEYPTENIQERTQKVFPQLLKLRESLAISSYPVGFLGTTGAGKSTTFNNILRVSEEDAPAKSGKGDATTSAVSRLRPARNGKNSLSLVYLTPEQFRKKRQAICEAVGLGHLLTNGELVNRLDSLQHEIHKGTREGLIKDVETLRLILTSYETYKATHVKEPPYTESKEYEQRARFLNHGSTQANGATVEPSAVFLLREAVIEFSTKVIPAELEMIDLPGLGSQGTIDSLLTLDFLEGLQGALIFLRADQLSDSNAEQILAKLKPAFDGRWSGRIWIVANKFDALGKDHFPAVGDTWFDGVEKFLQRHQLSFENLFIVSNKIHDAVNGNRSALTPAEIAYGKIDRKIDDPVFGRYPKFRPQLAQVYHDGGIETLRSLLTQRLAASIGAELLATARIVLSEIDRKLQEVKKAGERLRRSSYDDFEKAQACRSVVLTLLMDQSLRPLFRQPTLKLTEEFKKAFDKIQSVDILNTMSALDKGREFRVTTAALGHTFQNVFESAVLEPIYDEVRKHLEPLPKLAVVDSGTLQEAWQVFTHEDRQDKFWETRLPKFEDSNLWQELGGRNYDQHEMDGKDFRAVIQEKIRLVINETFHVVKVRIKCRLRLIEQDLAALIDKDPVPAVA